MIRRIVSHPLLRFVPLASVLIVGTALSLVALAWMRQQERERIQLEFDARAGQIEALVSRRVGATLEVLQSVERLFAASNEVDSEEFAEFTRDALENHRGILALAWAPRRPAGGGG